MTGIEAMGVGIMPARIKESRRQGRGRVKKPARTEGALSVAPTREQLGLTQETFVRLIGVSPRTVSHWENGGPINEVSLRRIKEMNRLALELRKTMKGDFIPVWLVTPNQGLEGFSPVEVMGRGETDRLWRVVFLLGSGIPI
jgi:transcriptional regulator with XRE-family HTH domain